MTTFLLLLLIATTSCREEGGSKLMFKHEVHATLGIACKDCHETGGVLPSFETCKTCHAEAMDSVTPVQVAAIIASRPAVPKPFGLAFSHEKHGSLECSNCHAIADGKMKRPVMATCLDACHGAEASYPLSCNACHTQLDAKGRPSSHAAGWQIRHGGTASASAEDCKSCHTEESCFSCHRVTKPANHTSAWRLRGHGVVAQADRERCLACHQENYCATCHLSTQPITHTQAWKGLNFWQHCNSCHLPLQDNNCATCHIDGAPHKSAPAWGPNHQQDQTHQPGADCRACHRGIGAGLNHPDNGDNCETCHAK